MAKIKINKLTWKTIISALFLLAGIIFYIMWGITYGVWADIGIYSITIVFVIAGIIGILLSFLEEETKK
ncbi:MAG: hypothetical protein GF329_10590 [Candidatus Lokiarchaeota archaeon]|nr:hypothetical protein [Candidatus Lokiarchaeota archaeon]